MPSAKSRKNSKTPLKPSNSDQSSSRSSSSSRVSFSEQPETNEEDISASLLEEASVRFPSFISNDAFIGRITDVESNYASNAAKIWLSESAMVASSLVPGYIVSVSIASSKRKHLGSSPLESLIDEHGWDTVDGLDKRSNGAGAYFAIAVVFPSSKVVKNGLRLSSSLACTMGNPTLGRIVFVSSIQTHSMSGFSNGTSTLQNLSVTTDSPLSFCKCGGLYLQIAQPKYRVSKQDDSASEVHLDELENRNPSSPKTPLSYKSKLNSPAVSSVTRCQDTVSNMRFPNETISDAYDIDEALGNIKSRELLQTCAALWLRDRFLLHGNLVTIPMGGKASTFLVQGADSESIESPREDSENEGMSVFSHKAKSVDVVLVIGSETKVDLNASSTTQTSGTRSSLLSVKPNCKDIKNKAAGHVLKLGGLSNEYTILKDIINSLSMRGPVSSLGLRSIKGVLLHGPPGTGKTSLARSCVIDAGINFFSINGPEIIGQFHGESEQALCEIFDSASKSSPAAVFIDELDAIAPARKDGGDELSQRMVATLLNLMDGISQTDGILVIAATNRSDSIDPALRRPGRLEREIEIGVPSPEKRFDILRSLLYKMDHALIGTEIQHLASNTHGFVGADLTSLCNEAALVCLRRHIRLKNSLYSSSVADQNVQSKEPCISCPDDPVLPLSSLPDLAVSSQTAQEVDCMISDNLASELNEEAVLKISFDDFEVAKRKVRPSAMREVILEIPKVRWEDVGGQNEAKKQLMEAVEWPQKHREAFERIGTRPPTGVLMFGPPGCSKTLMARAVASEAGLNFLSVKGPELFSKWVGESEKAVKSVFAKARANAPAIIFFDEIDGLAVIRGKESGGVSVSDRVMSQLLVELDGLHQRVDVTVIAATNRPDKIDSALLRPGRFDRLLYIGPPNEADREEIFGIHVRRMPCGSDVRIKELARLSEGCTGADIALICREAAFAAIEESLEVSEVSMEHFKAGIRRVQPSGVVGHYQYFCKKFQRNVLSNKVVVEDGSSSFNQSSIPPKSGIKKLLKPVAFTAVPVFCILCAVKSFFRVP